MMKWLLKSWTTAGECRTRPKRIHHIVKPSPLKFAFIHMVSMLNYLTHDGLWPSITRKIDPDIHRLGSICAPLALCKKYPGLLATVAIAGMVPQDQFLQISMSARVVFPTPRLP
jgi:hypothetical protein